MILLAEDRCALYGGESPTVWAELPDCSVDSLVTDPPAGIGFMGREWDSDKGGADLPQGLGPWLAGFVDGEGNFDIHRQKRESGEYFYCRFELSLRADDGGVLQMLQRTLGGKVYYSSPGEGLNEKARWELVSRKECARLVGLFDRFPLQSKKSRDFAIWREALAVSLAHEGTSRPDLMEPFWTALRGTRPFSGTVTAPSAFREMANGHQWIAWLTGVMRECMRVLKPGGHGLVWALPRTSHWTATALEDAGFEVRDVVTHLFGTGFPKSLNVVKAGAPEQWNGWGTALKPASEHWILVRKPLEGTVAANVAKWGTGAINVDGCRIGTESTRRLSNAGTNGDGWGMGKAAHVNGSDSGRWPANLTLDEEAAALLDAQSGVRKSGALKPHKEAHENATSFKMAREKTLVKEADSGGASRFFYVSKVSRAERDFGCADLPVKSGAEATDSREGQARLNSPRTGAGRTGGVRNHHPTVKSFALMRWLVRLITPPGGVVLDPFAGSGTTGVAALLEGFEFIGAEASPEYQPIAVARLTAALNAAPTEE